MGRRRILAWGLRNGFTLEDTGGFTEALVGRKGTLDITIVPESGGRFNSLRQRVSVGVQPPAGRTVCFTAGPLGDVRFA